MKARKWLVVYVGCIFLGIVGSVTSKLRSPVGASPNGVISRHDTPLQLRVSKAQIIANSNGIMTADLWLTMRNVGKTTVAIHPDWPFAYEIDIESDVLEQGPFDLTQAPIDLSEPRLLTKNEEVSLRVTVSESDLPRFHLNMDNIYLGQRIRIRIAYNYEGEKSTTCDVSAIITGAGLKSRPAYLRDKLVKVVNGKR